MNEAVLEFEGIGLGRILLAQGLSTSAGGSRSFVTNELRLQVSIGESYGGMAYRGSS